MCDDEMAQVAEKHGGGAASLKSLAGLTCVNFLQEAKEGESRYTLAAKIRGVGVLVIVTVLASSSSGWMLILNF